MLTPNWKKRFIIIFGLFENLIFSGTILGWSALNYMLKSEGVYQYICDPHYEIDYLEYRNNSAINGNIGDKNDGNIKNKLKAEKILNPFNKAIEKVLLSDTHTNGSNITFLEEIESFNVEPRFSPIYKSKGCGAQDKILNLAFTIGSFCMGFTAFIWGFLLNKWGLRIVRLLINCLITGGALLLCFTNKDRPYLIFPAVTLLCFGGVPLRIANMQFADLYPSRRSTFISLYSGAFCASAVIFVILKYFYDFGVSYFYVTLLLASLSFLMFPFTLFILPSDRIREDSEETNQSLFNNKSSNLYIISPVTLEKFTLISSPCLTRKSHLSNYENGIDNMGFNNNYIDSKPVNVMKEQIQCPNIKKSGTSVPPLRISLWSWSFNLHQWWFSWLITYMVMYVGSLNLWLQRVTDDLQTAGKFAKIYGIAQVLGLILAPIAGIFMDYTIRKADQETDPFKRKLQRVRAGFLPLFTTTVFLTACLVCRFFDSENAILISIGFMTIFRSFLIAVGTAYLRIRFHGEHFNRLLGIMSTMGAVVSLLQFPLFVWESKTPSNAIWVNFFNCFCTLIAFTNPLHLLITPFQKYLLRKEEKEEAEAKSK